MALVTLEDGPEPVGTGGNPWEPSRATQPVFGPYVNGMIAPCAFWPTEPREPGTAIANDVPVLMLQARHDNNVTANSPAPV